MSDKYKFPYGTNKPPSSLIIPSALPFDFQITVMFNTRNGNTELRLSSLSVAVKQINLLQVAGILSEHSCALLRQLCSGKNVETVPVTLDENAGDVNNGEQSKT